MHSALNRKRDIYRLWKWQCYLLVFITLAVAIRCKTTAWSVFLGGVTFLLPYTYFVWKSFQRAGAMQVKRIFWDMCAGQAAKLLLTGLLFLLAFKVVHPQIGPYFAGFLVMQATLWLMVWMGRGQA